MVCRKKCDVGTYYDPEDDQNCLQCSDAISWCENCQTVDGVGSELICTGCGNVLRPNEVLDECIHMWCDEIDSFNPLICNRCDKNYFRAFDTTRCWWDCMEKDDYVQHQEDDYTERMCGAKCDTDNDEYLQWTTKLCKKCDSSISGCTSCMENDNFSVSCDDCVEGMHPTWDTTQCSRCGVDQFEEADGSCKYCSDNAALCGRCTAAKGNDAWVCNDCLGDIDWKQPEQGGQICACEYVEYVGFWDEGDRNTAYCKKCHEEIEDCNGCQYEILPEDFTDPTWYSAVMCTECREPLFIGEFGSCTEEPCRFWDDEGMCVECNVQLGQTYITQEDTCLPKCTYPYEDIEGRCDIICDDGFYLGNHEVEGSRCTDCNVKGCKVCTTQGKCTYCFEEGHESFHADCQLTCPSPTFNKQVNIPVYDYTPTRGGPRCSSECDAENSLMSLREISGFNRPFCRYCGVGCESCIESTVSDELFCEECDDNLLILGGNCVKECPLGECYEEEDGVCVRTPGCIEEWERVPSAPAP